MEGRTFVDTVNFDKDSVTLQNVALAEMRMPIFREAPLAVVRELYEQEQDEPQLSDGELDALLISAVMDRKVQNFPDATALDEALNAVPAGNFRITDDHLGEGGAKQKYARNIEAIRTLFRLEAEHRVPPPRSSRCFRNMWAGAVWQMPLTPARTVGQRNTPN